MDQGKSKGSLSRRVDSGAGLYDGMTMYGKVAKNVVTTYVIRSANYVSILLTNSFFEYEATRSKGSHHDSSNKDQAAFSYHGNPTNADLSLTKKRLSSHRYMSCGTEHSIRTCGANCDSPTFKVLAHDR